MTTNRIIYILCALVKQKTEQQQQQKKEKYLQVWCVVVVFFVMVQCIYLLYIKSINIGIKSGNIVRRMLGAFLKVIPGKWYIYATHTAICTYDTAGAAAAANNDHFIQKLKN